jgi:hypothetical protein
MSRSAVGTFAPTLETSAAKSADLLFWPVTLTVGNVALSALALDAEAGDPGWAPLAGVAVD